MVLETQEGECSIYVLSFGMHHNNNNNKPIGMMHIPGLFTIPLKAFRVDMEVGMKASLF
jgi:hypothetical protein